LILLNETSGGDFKLIKKLNTGAVLLLDCRIELLPAGEGKGSIPLIACAGSDNNIHLFNVQSAAIDGVDLDYIPTIKVSGHEDWVRTLSFTVDGSYNSACYFCICFD